MPLSSWGFLTTHYPDGIIIEKNMDQINYMTEIIVYTVIYASYVILRLRKAVLKSKKAKAKIAQMVKEA